jgi:penicillin-binding protein 1A
MRKKNAGALFMDFHISPEDRVGAVGKKSRSRGGKPAAQRGGRASGRVEPRFAALDDEVQAEEPPARRQPAAVASGSR